MFRWNIGIITSLYNQRPASRRWFIGYFCFYHMSREKAGQFRIDRHQISNIKRFYAGCQPQRPSECYKVSGNSSPRSGMQYFFRLPVSMPLQTLCVSGITLSDHSTALTCRYTRDISTSNYIIFKILYKINICFEQLKTKLFVENNHSTIL